MQGPLAQIPSAPKTPGVCCISGCPLSSPVWPCVQDWVSVCVLYVHQAVTLSSRLFILKADAPSRACLTGAGAVTILAKPQLGLAPALLSPQLFGQVIQDHGSCVLAPRAQVPSLCATIYWCVTCLQDGDNNLPILHALFFLTFVF